MADPGRGKCASGDDTRRWSAHIPGLRSAGPRIALAITCSWYAISACTDKPETTALPRPPDRVGVSAFLEPFALAKMADHAQSVGVPPSFDLEVWPTDSAVLAAEDGRLQMLISAGSPPPGWFATPLGFEGIAIIVNRGNPVRELTSRQVGELFSGLVQTWDEIDGLGEPVRIVIPPPGDVLRGQLETLSLGARRFPMTAVLAPSPAAMVTLIRESQGAIGFLPLSSIPEGVRVVSIDGEAPTLPNLRDGGYPLRFEVTAIAPVEPQGGVRDWLVWIQEQE